MCLLAIVFVGLLSISWFYGNFLISSVDFNMPVNRIQYFIANFFTWDSRTLGSFNPRILALTVPLGTFFAFSEIAGLSIVTTEKILFYCVFTISGLSMYYLTTNLLSSNSHRFKNIAGLISALFYMLNPYVAINILPIKQVSYIIYALFPLVFALFIKGLNNKHVLKSALLVVFPLLISTSVFVDPSFVPIVLFPLVFYLLFYLVTNRSKTAISQALKFSGATIVIWLLLNLYWLIPDLYSGANELVKVTAAYGSIGTSFQSLVQLNSANFLGGFRLLGYWALNSGYRGDLYILWGPTYQNLLFVIIGFMIPLLALIPILTQPKDRHVIFFALLAVVSLFLINGDNSSVGRLVYSVIPLFSAFFNTPYLRFGMYLTFAYAFLIGYSLAQLSVYLDSCCKKIRGFARRLISVLPILLILFLIIGVYAFPLWTGDVMRTNTSVLPSNRYQLPSYYQDASKWLGTDASNFNIIILPISNLGYGELKWANGGYEGPYPAQSLFPKTLIVSSLAGNGLIGQAAQLIIENSTLAACKLLALLNVKYVMFNEDANWPYIENNPSWISCPPDQFQSILSSSGAFTLKETFGQLVFYQNNYWQPTEVYSASSSILSDGNLDELTQIAERSDFTPCNSIIVLSNQLNSQQISALPMNTLFVQNPDSNSIYSPVSGVQNGERLVYAINSQPFATARYYSGWKGVISTNGQGDPGMIIFSSPSQCPYLNAFPMNFNNWSSYDSTLVYIKTSQPLTIDSVAADGTTVAVQAWWQTGTSWTVGWPITIPSDQNAVIQVNQKAGSIILQTDEGPITLSVTDGWENPFTPPSSSGTPTVFVPDAGEYLLAINASTGTGYGSLSVKIDNQSFSVNLNSQEQGPIYAYEYVGPIYLTAGDHTITTSKGGTPVQQVNDTLLYSLKNGESFANADNLLPSSQQSNASVMYEEINPTQYTVHVNASQPFYLIFSQSYDNGWVATINGQQISDEYHFTANGYANGWYINKTGAYTITLEFTPQNLFYAGAAISITTITACALYVSKSKIKNVYKKCVRRSKVSN